MALTPFLLRTAGLRYALAVLLPMTLAAEVITPYTSSTSFFADLSSPSLTVDFEGFGDGTLLPNGSHIDGITLQQAAVGQTMRIVEGFSQTSGGGSGSLGLTGGDDAFLSGDHVLFTLASPALAIGMYVIGSPGDIRPGDLRLDSGTAEVFNGTPELVLPDGGDAYFLGLIVTEPDMGSAITDAVLSSLDPEALGLFVFNIDDITVSMPDGEADLIVSKSGPVEAELGTVIQYAIEVGNEGPSHALGVELFDAAPPGLVFLSNSGDVTTPYPFTISVIPTGMVLAVQSAYRVPATYQGPVLATNTIAAFSLTPDPNPGQETARAVTIIDPSGDRDADRLSNRDEIVLGTDPENDDTDADGLGDGAETMADTNPTDEHSVLIVDEVELSETGIRVDWRGGVSVTQVLESISDLTSAATPWTSIFTNLPPTPVTNSAVDPDTNTERRFYRIRIPE